MSSTSSTRRSVSAGVQSVWSTAVLLAACGGAPAPAAQPEVTPEPQVQASGPAATGSAALAPSSAETNSAEGAAVDPSSAEPKRPGATVAETRTTQVMQSIVVQNRQQIRACYEAALNQQPDLQGKLTVHFTIDSAGKVTAADVNQSRTTLKDPKIQACALAAIRAINFPRSSRGFESTVNYPFDFKPN